MDAQTPRTAYEFGDFRVDVPQRLLLLRDGGRPLPLSSRAFDTLLFFLEHPGELLDKSTLMAAIWPKLVVEEFLVHFQARGQAGKKGHQGLSM